MTSPFSIRTTPCFERMLVRLTRAHPDLVDHYAEAIAILAADPYNRSRAYNILKLEGVRQGEGQYRLRLRRFRFRYDIVRQEVVLHSCSLRREDTYR
jgi:hypothetical protein